MSGRNEQQINSEEIKAQIRQIDEERAELQRQITEAELRRAELQQRKWDLVRQLPFDEQFNQLFR